MVFVKPQAEQILTLMRRGWVSPLVALDQCRSFRFSARVLEIKRAGHDLEHRDQTGPDGKRYREFRVKGAG